MEMNGNLNIGEGLLAIGTTLQNGRYRVERYLASGGFGNTYLVMDAQFGCYMVVKEFFMKGLVGRDQIDGRTVRITLDTNRNTFDSQLRKFEREAMRVRQLDHPNIVRVHDLFHENGTAYYVMDYVDGETLAERMTRNGAMSENEVLQILPQLLVALELVHANGLFHLDLKPGNVMLDRSGLVRLIDFGASKQMRADGGATTTPDLAYTPGYAAPELINGQVDRIGVSTDIYGLGATLYNLLTAQTPPSWVDLNEYGEGALRYPGIVVSERMRYAISQMMTPSRLKRPQSIAQVRQLIYYNPAPVMSQAISRPQVAHQPVSRPLSTPVPTKSNNGLKIAAVLSVALMVFAITVAVVFFMLSSSDESPKRTQPEPTPAPAPTQVHTPSNRLIGQYRYSGAIGPASVNGTMNYSDNGSFSGQYGYRGRTTGISINGTHSPDGTWTATEYNDQGMVCGTYNGHANGTTITGSFTNYRGTTYSFRLMLTPR